ncbi:unnamed protein product [Calicophoron daubneyi]|uniref:RNA cytidine acetyltransferase n=1 Tax=Calicophoron daubneyi TaxID=300641 RepID=A0AAV2T9Q2_CALDB
MGKLQKLDNRIRIILQQGIALRHRTVFVMIGNKGQDQVPIMHQILNSLSNRGRLSILWCYKKELSFSTHRKRNLKLLNKQRKAGITSDATIFEQFICTTDIRWCYYHETQNILGQTFDMCVLQDFEALTPNTLARTIETVSGGGLIVLLLKSMNSLRQLCTMVMDVHARYRTEAHQDVVCRFNERFLLSLTNNARCLVLDDRWRILPLSKKVLLRLQAVDIAKRPVTAEQEELQKLKVSLTEDGSPFAPLVKLCVTFDQARSLVQFCASLASTNQMSLGSDKSMSKSDPSLAMARSLLDSIGTNQMNVESASAIVVVTASRGRGKSAALGLGLAAAIETGLPNLYATAPSPENLSTLMQFVVRGLVAFGYEEHQDFVATRSTDPNYNQAIVRIDVHRQKHRQSLVYLTPSEMANHLGSGSQQADLVCVDEAAAIPLALVRLFISGPRLVFMASTVNGYEGTGRSLSLKLIKQLRNECKLSDITLRLQPRPPLPTLTGNASIPKQENVTHLGKGLKSADTSRVLYEVTLSEAIRYANGDPVEAWLNELLCLDCGSTLISDIPNPNAYYPPVDQCQLYYVNRDTLFAYHKSTELFLHRLMGLYVASHYKNSPNDLQLLSDAPAHHIFCLLAPYDPESGRVPEILCVLQVCLEGKINKDIILRSLSRGVRPSGDLIPWTVSQQFCDAKFGELSGARVVRIATHPEYQNLGYGTRALRLLYDYYSGNIPTTDAKRLGAETSNVDLTRSDLGFSTTEQNARVAGEESDEEPIDQSTGSDAENESLTGVPESERKNTSFLLTETIERRGPSSLPPLLSRLSERPPEELDYIGVSFGATPSLIRFWKRSGYLPVYLRQSLNELTGEFSCIMIRQVERKSVVTENWLLSYHTDFIRRFLYLLPGTFRYMDAAYALELIHHKFARYQSNEELTPAEVARLFTSVDLERLHRYIRSLVDFHVISDLLPTLARLFFEKRLSDVRLNKTQQVILLGMGLQYKTVERLACEFNRLLGEGTGGSSKDTDRKQLEDASMILARVEEANISSTSASVELGTKSSLKHKGPDTNVTTGWTKRIRGLMFVFVRELVRGLDRISEANTPTKSKTAAVNVQLNTEGDSLVAGGHVALTLDETRLDAESSDDDEMEEEQSDEEDDKKDGLVSLAEAEDETQLSGSEVERRTSIVRQFMSEELTTGGVVGSLNSYKVHGTEADWAQAVAGHGSNLASLNVHLPPPKPEEKPKKKNKKRPFDEADTKTVRRTKKHQKQKKAKWV